MAISFPASPSLNQVYTYSGRSWIWNGYAWAVYPSSFTSGLTVGASTITGGAAGQLMYDTGGIFSETTAITTDGVAALTLGTQGTTQGSLVLGNTATSFSTTIKSSNSSTSAWTLTLPVAPPAANGYVLSSTTAGVTSWIAAAAAGITINTTTITGGTSGNFLYDNSGTVGEVTPGTGVATAFGNAVNTAGGFVVSSATLAANSVVIGGGAGVSPSTTTTGTGVVAAIGNNTNTAGGILVPASALTANALVIGGGSGTGPSTTTTGTGVLTAIGNNVNTAGGLLAPAAALTANAIVIGGGSGTGPSTTTTGTGVLTAIGNNTNSANGLAVLNGSGALPIAQGGTAKTSYTTGSVIYYNGTSLNEDNANFFWDGTNHRLGIGTTTPSNALTVTSDALIHGLTVGLGGGSNANNTAIGTGALANTTNDSYNVAVGYNALAANTTGGQSNVAVGYAALASNTSGNSCTALGTNAATANTTGIGNIAIGGSALASNTSGGNNVIIGPSAVTSHTGTSNNVVIGQGALQVVTTGNANTIIGKGAFNTLTSGSNNIAIGLSSGSSVTSGSNNVIIGSAGTLPGGATTGSNYLVLSDGSGNIRQAFDSSGLCVLNQTSSWAGAQFDVLSSTTWAISGYCSTASGAGAFLARVDSTSTNLMGFYYNTTQVAWITTNGSTVVFNNAALSDERWKENIQPIENALETVMETEFITFSYKESGNKSAGVRAQQAETIPGLSDFVIDGVSEDDYKAFDYNALVGVLGKAIQELKAEFDAYKATHP